MPEGNPSGDALPKQAIVAAEPLLIGPKRQHFLPRFYLNGFAENGRLAVFDREANEIRVQTPENTGVIGHFYTLEGADGRKRFELEQFLSEYETKASPIVRKLAARQEITPDERADLAMFVALAAFRTPDIVDSLKLFNSGMIGDMAKRTFADVEQVKAMLRGKPNVPSSDDELEVEARELVEFVQGGRYEITTKHSWAVGMAMKISFNVAPIFAGRDWVVFHRDTERKSFVTTDAPVLLTTVTPRENSFWGIGFGNRDALVLFPLTASCILAMYGNSGRFEHRTVGTVQIRHTNLVLADRCQRFVIGRDESLIRSLSDYLGLASKQWQAKMQRM